MPHAPTLVADERKMVATSSGQAFEEWRYQSLINDERRLFSTADVVVFPSPNAAQAYVEAFTDLLDQTRIEYVKSGVPDTRSTDRDRPDSERHVKRPRVIYAGRYVSHKGYDLFCEAASLLAESHPDVKFASIGTGPLRPSEAVEDLGWLEDPHSTIAAHDLAVIPNRVAYYDLLPLEVSSLGVPMVMTAVGGNLDQAALLPETVVCNADPLSIADAILAALQRVDDASFCGRNRHAFLDHFSDRAMAQAWDEMLSSVSVK